MAKTKYTTTIAGREFTIRKSKYTTNLSPLHISDDMTGKLFGIPSISTCCSVNPFCLARMQNGNSICAHCFAEALMKMKPSVRDAMISNFYLLTESILDLDLLPRFKNVTEVIVKKLEKEIEKLVKLSEKTGKDLSEKIENRKHMLNYVMRYGAEIVRLESFGDVYNTNQAINYLNIVRVNPNQTFAWWSKNMGIVKAAIEMSGGKPDNLILVESAPIMDTTIKPSNEYVDKTFTVFRKSDDDPFINCGGRCCLTCQTCYHKETESDIREALK